MLLPLLGTTRFQSLPCLQPRTHPCKLGCISSAPLRTTGFLLHAFCAMLPPGSNHTLFTGPSDCLSIVSNSLSLDRTFGFKQHVTGKHNPLHDIAAADRVVRPQSSFNLMSFQCNQAAHSIAMGFYACSSFWRFLPCTSIAFCLQQLLLFPGLCTDIKSVLVSISILPFRSPMPVFSSPCLRLRLLQIRF